MAKGFYDKTLSDEAIASQEACEKHGHQWGYFLVGTCLIAAAALAYALFPQSPAHIFIDVLAALTIVGFLKS